MYSGPASDLTRSWTELSPSHIVTSLVHPPFVRTGMAIAGLELGWCGVEQAFDMDMRRSQRIKGVVFARSSRSRGTKQSKTWQQR